MSWLNEGDTKPFTASLGVHLSWGGSECWEGRGGARTGKGGRHCHQPRSLVCSLAPRVWLRRDSSSDTGWDGFFAVRVTHQASSHQPHPSRVVAFDAKRKADRAALSLKMLGRGHKRLGERILDIFPTLLLGNAGHPHAPNKQEKQREAMQVSVPGLCVIQLSNLHTTRYIL
ncbi:hypothetical protein MGYG_07963 [Nannizzia gypsea CBS 118893]|uniref:Uncharacterized protein n=1 Tax=Arthroderma gypseum (strain ATCC MYA-4604 / CBS 118893) TaxID=535722 RepID=E4V4N6_ARTGP|nr:hypothetical protein MGYG_07963 [Nannizzia gypsea CBS 118893]EFR04960.1 hypothetical protein MGYG_07963 [Nannizzia gypsea CBS 118893]